MVADAWVNPLAASDACSDIDEIHRKFISVHYILSGREFFGCCDAERLDCNVWEDFIIVFPEDAHTIISDFDKSKELVTVIAKVRIFLED